MPKIINAIGEDVNATLTLSFRLPSGSSLLDIVSEVIARGREEARDSRDIANDVLVALGFGDQFEAEN